MPLLLKLQGFIFYFATLFCSGSLVFLMSCNALLASFSVWGDCIMLFFVLAMNGFDENNKYGI